MYLVPIELPTTCNESNWIMPQPTVHVALEMQEFETIKYKIALKQVMIFKYFRNAFAQ